MPVALPGWMVEQIDEWRKGGLGQSRAQAIRSLLRVALDREKRVRKKRKETVKKRLGRSIGTIVEREDFVAAVENFFKPSAPICSCPCHTGGDPKHFPGECGCTS